MPSIRPRKRGDSKLTKTSAAEKKPTSIKETNVSPEHHKFFEESQHSSKKLTSTIREVPEESEAKENNSNFGSNEKQSINVKIPNVLRSGSKRSSKSRILNSNKGNSALFSRPNQNAEPLKIDWDRYSLQYASERDQKKKRRRLTPDPTPEPTIEYNSGQSSEESAQESSTKKAKRSRLGS